MVPLYITSSKAEHNLVIKKIISKMYNQHK